MFTFLFLYCNIIYFRLYVFIVMINYYVYLITNNVNKKNYVGQRKLNTNSCKTKILTPENDKYMGSGTYLKNAQKTYGIQNFSKDILAVCYDERTVNILETEYIRLYKGIGKAEYNIAKGGHEYGLFYYDETKRKEIQEKINMKLADPEVKRRMSESHKGISTWNKGIPMSDDAKEKLKLSLCKIDCSERSRKAAETRRRNGYKMSEQHKQAIIKANFGKHRSQQTIDKIVKKTTGQKRTEEQKQRMSQAQQKRWRVHPVSEETRRKLSLANKGQVPYMKGKHHTEESKLKISRSVSGEKNGFYNKHHTEETKRKLSEIGRQRKVSEETRLKISQTMKQVLAQKKNINN